MTLPILRNGTIAAQNGIISSTLDGSDALNPNRLNRRYEAYEITGNTAGKAIEVSLEASFDAYLEIVDANTGVIVAEDDQGGTGNDSRLSFLPVPGVSYLARATTYDPQETGPFTLRTRLIDPADLQVIAASGPSTASIGSRVEVSWTLRNNGPGVAGSEWIDSIYLSTNSIYDANDTRITDFWPDDTTSDGASIPLASGGTRIRTLRFSAPSVSSAGLYYFIIRTDSYSNQAETNETNNTAAIPITFDLRGPDLQITAASAPTATSTGTPLTFSWTVKNTGTNAASTDYPWEDVIFLSSDPVLDDGDIFIASQFSPGYSPSSTFAPLLPGASYTTTTTISAPGIAAGGQYYLIFSTDHDSDQGEQNEQNNTFVLPISYDSNGPDLLTTSASAPASASIGSLLNVSWTVKNNGTRTADSDWWDGIYLSTNATFDSSDTYINAFSAADISPLAAGASYTVSKTISAPSVTSAGQYFLIFRTDAFANQGETNETNNSTSLPISLDLNGPDLQITAVTAPATASIGSALNVSWTVKNNGTRTAESTWWDGIYLSADAIHDQDDTILSSFYAGAFSPLAPGASYTLNQTIATPSGATAGRYYLIFRADTYSHQGETIEPNNTLISPLTLTSGITALPVVSLAVSPVNGVMEDGSSDLIYTFTRTGPTTDSLTVNYTVSGTALQGTDYIGISPWTPENPVKTITFAAGSNTVTVVVDPITDNTVEADETILLTLASGNGYTIGTPSAVTGVILNDDLPLVSLAVAPSLGVTEDGSDTLIYTFTRTGPTNTTLTVAFNVGGSASLSAGDYSQQGALSFNGTSGFINFAAGASTATITVDPTTDPDPEPDETLILSLAPGVSYSIGASNSATGTIRNDDIVIEASGNTTLLRRGDGQAFAQVGGGSRTPITSPWGVTIGSPTSTWQILAADIIGGVNQLLWRNNTGNFLHTWTLDSNWTWTASSGTFALNDSPGWDLEVSFQVDANGDGTIGTPCTTIEARGNTTLLSRNDGRAFAQVGTGPRLQITSPWGVSIGSTTSTWQVLAADTVAGVNQILLRNNIGNFLHTWSLDSNWNWTSSGGTFPLNDASGWTLESTFQVDANGDGVIGAPLSTIEARGTTTLLRRPSDDQAFVQVGSGPRTQVTTPWGAPIGGTTSTWQILAAETIGGVNQVLLRNNPGNFLHTWTLDSNWNWTSSGGTFPLNEASGWSLETSFQVDANGDGVIGAPLSTIEAQGNTTLLRRGSDDQAFVQVGTGPRTQVTTPWGAPIGRSTSTWQILAADTIAGVNQVLLRNNPGNFLHTWSLDSNWNWTSSGGTFALDDTPGWSLESTFQVDANNDGIIGSPFSTIESRGGTTLLRRGSDDQAFIQVGTGPRTQVTTPWGAPIGGTTSTWQILAAETIGGVNQLLLRNNPGNFLHTWTLNSNWTWTASNGTISPTSAQGLALLNQFGLG